MRVYLGGVAALAALMAEDRGPAGAPATDRPALRIAASGGRRVPAMAGRGPAWRLLGDGEESRSADQGA